MNERKITFSDISSTSVIVEFEDTKHKYHNDNETETNLVTLDKETEKFPYITYPAIMEECGNKEHDDKYYNETETNLVIMDKVIEKFPYMKSPAMME